MSMNVSYDEYQLMSLYNEGTRGALISNLMEPRIKKLRAMSDAEFDELALSPDYFEEMEDTYAE